MLLPMAECKLRQPPTSQKRRSTGNWLPLVLVNPSMRHGELTTTELVWIENLQLTQSSACLINSNELEKECEKRAKLASYTMKYLSIRSSVVELEA